MERTKPKEHISAEKTLLQQASVVANTITAEQEELPVDERSVVVKLGSPAYARYLRETKAMIIGKCKNSDGCEFAVFVTS